MKNILFGVKKGMMPSWTSSRLATKIWLQLGPSNQRVKDLEKISLSPFKPQSLSWGFYFSLAAIFNHHCRATANPEDLGASPQTPFLAAGRARAVLVAYTNRQAMIDLNKGFTRPLASVKPKDYFMG
jgi:hypothetical protein